MKFEEEEQQYHDVVKTLKSLQKVKAPAYFEADLKRRINSADFGEEKKKKSFWEGFLSPAKILPSAGLALSAIILLFILNTGSEDPENPLLLNPRVREDVVESSGMPEISLNYKADKPSAKIKANGLNPADSNELASKDADNSRSSEFAAQAPAVYQSSFAVDKSGLNFRQIQLSAQEREILRQMKERLKSIMDQKNSSQNGQ